MWILLNGHGVWVPGETFNVPPGMTLHFFSYHGVFTLDKPEVYIQVANEIRPDAYVVESIAGGAECHEYMLSAPVGLCAEARNKKAGKFQYNIQEREGVPLSAILGLRAIENMTDVYVYACRSAPRRRYVGELTKERVKEIKRQFEFNATAADLELFMEDRVAWTMQHLDDALRGI